MSISITERQFDVLQCIHDFIEEKSYCPTVREICDALGLSSPSTVHVHLRSLMEKGFIERDPKKSRSITLTAKGRAELGECKPSAAVRADSVFSGTSAASDVSGAAAASTSTAHAAHTMSGAAAVAADAAHAVSFSKTIDLPLVGNVAAGQPIFADENITDTMSLPVDIVGDSASFLLAVRGESMIEAGIMDGDFVVVKEQPTASNGDIVVAIIDDSATVKRFYRESDHIRLQPENAAMKPIIVTDCLIAGKVVAVFRRL